MTRHRSCLSIFHLSKNLPGIALTILAVSVIGGTNAMAKDALSAKNSPANNPVADYKLPWTDMLKWSQVVSIADMPGDTAQAKLAAAQEQLAKQGGGVIYFPAGTYKFADSIKLRDGNILRGENPTGAKAAKDEAYALATKFEFPKYQPKLDGDGTPIDTAFKGIYLESPTASNVGLVHIDINRGHIHFASNSDHTCGKNKLVVGCILRNAATADKNIPDAKIEQKPWQRFTSRHHAAIDVQAEENVLISNNRLPKSGDDNFTMNGYLAKGRKTVESLDGVVFDYDNRPGIYINSYGMGAAGGQNPDGNPTEHPWCFRKGIVIRDNYIFATGRCAISFTGDGTICSFNTIRFPNGVWRPTATGTGVTFGSSTNDNRAVQMRGYRWTVEGNDYEVHRNLAADRIYPINDGEGLMHEDHVNSTIVDSRLINNKGNSYLSLFHTGGVNGLHIEGNDIRVPKGISAIYVVADKHKHPTRYECKNVTIINNTTSGSGITIGGSPAENNLIKNNKHIGLPGKLINRAQAKLEGNEGYEVAE